MTSNANAMPKSTDGEVRLLLIVLKNMKTPQVDWDAVAREGDYNNSNTARARFGTVKNKLGLIASPAGSTSAEAPVKRGGQGSSGSRAKRPKTQHDDLEDFDIIKKEEDEEDKKFIVLD
ncbi:uncharacterized protein PG986_009710 [Apiospora aurea]|uniref:Myb-like DNA-binding domain-containing protein n=1 Tax=Apiospora aurea TaxID=335848 RepID=A0ABR1Q8T6_9PEZI